MTLSRIIAFLCALLPVLSVAQPGTYIAYGPQHGLESNSTYDITQDQEGFIWISSSNGVYRFDGTHFRHFGIEDGLPDNEVLKVSVDRYGRVWFYCFNGRLGYYRKGRFFNERHMPALAQVRLLFFRSGFYEGRDDTYWIPTPEQPYTRLKVSADSILSCSTTPYAAIAYWEDGSASYHCTNDSVYKNGHPLAKFKSYLGREHCDPCGDALYCLRADGLSRFRGDREQLIFPLARELHADKLRVQSPGRFFIGCSKDRVLEVYGTPGQALQSRIYEDVCRPGNAFSDNKGNTWITSPTGSLYYYPRNIRTSRSAKRRADWPGRAITDIRVCGTQVLAGFENGSVAAFDKELDLMQVLLGATDPIAPVRAIFLIAYPGN